MADELFQPEEGAQAENQPAPEANNTHIGEAASSEGSQEPKIQSVQFGQIAPGATTGSRNPLDLILDVRLQATVELGRTHLMIREILNLGPGSVVELDKLAGEPADLLVNGKPLARGEVVVIDENFGIRITEIIAPTERINGLR